MQKKYLYQWWYEIDTRLFTALTVLMLVGLIMVMAAGPAVAERISLTQFHFLEKQLLSLGIAFITMMVIAALNESILKKIMGIGFFVTIIIMIIVLFFGDQTKGAKRWLNISTFALQPSEFLKPFYSGVVAMILASTQHRNRLEVFLMLVGLHIAIVFLLLMQPDFGMAVVISAVFSIQMFIAEIPILWLLILCCLFLSCIVMTYYLFPHVARRIEKFLESSDTSANYQVQKSLESYINGGLWGKGPGEGKVKYHLPDSHTDFIFPVAAEELGIVFCISVILLIIFIVIRCFTNIIQIKYSLYRLYCSVGIIGYFVLQSIFNVAVTLHLVPTKGMTLPFVSYGGSSLVAQAFAMGIYLNITRYIDRIGLKKRSIHVRM